MKTARHYTVEEDYYKEGRIRNLVKEEIEQENSEAAQEGSEVIGEKTSSFCEETEKRLKSKLAEFKEGRKPYLPAMEAAEEEFDAIVIRRIEKQYQKNQEMLRNQERRKVALFPSLAGFSLGAFAGYKIVAPRIMKKVATMRSFKKLAPNVQRKVRIGVQWGSSIVIGLISGIGTFYTSMALQK